MSDWMTEEYGIPHKNGMVRFYLIGADEGMYEYLGWFDMTNWDKGWVKVQEAAENSQCGGETDDEDYQIIRHDQLMELSFNIHFALQEALKDKDETTFGWWWKHKTKKENNNG